MRGHHSSHATGRPQYFFRKEVQSGELSAQVSFCATVCALNTVGLKKKQLQDLSVWATGATPRILEPTASNFVVAGLSESQQEVVTNASPLGCEAGVQLASENS